MSVVTADVWADLITWALTTLPLLALHHMLLRRHITRVTNAQTRTIQRGGGQ